MRLPRRVPWAHIGELEQVCSWIYSDENDLDAKVLAVNRLAAWKAITSLPHALESAHAILTVVLQDSALQGQDTSSYLSLRQSYATAVIRLVNGLVDPLQLGAYARSINSIATQLGLPAWLVELRHAATHEDLPSIEVLREAARQALAWLLQNYFLPTLNPTTPNASQLERPSLRPLSPLLKQYKAFAKATARDASLTVKYKHDMARVLRDMERWIAEAKVAAPVGATAWDDIDGEEGDEVDAREGWALERLAEALLERGALVPVSKKKRMLSAATFYPSSAILNIWAPLLTHLQDLHPTLPTVLTHKAISRLCDSTELDMATQTLGADVVLLDADQERERQKQDASYDRCVAGWTNWLVDTCSGNVHEDEDEDGDVSIDRTDAALKLVSALGPAKSVSGTREKTVQDLLRAMSRGRPALERASALVLNMPQPPLSGVWQEADMQLMHDRLTALLAVSGRAASSSTSISTVPEMAMADAGHSSGDHTDPAGPVLRLPAGWRRVSREDGWRPSPIGVFVHCAG